MRSQPLLSLAVVALGVASPVASAAPTAPQVVVQRIAYSSALAVDPSGRLLVSNYLGLSFYALPTRALVATVPVQVERVTFGAGGKWLLLTGISGVVLADVDILDAALRGTVDPAGAAYSFPHAPPSAVARDAHRLLQIVTEGAATALVEVDGDRAIAAPTEPPPTVRRWPVPAGCDGIALRPDGLQALVICAGGLHRVDLKTGTIHALPRASAVPAGSLQAELAADGRRALVYAEETGRDVTAAWVGLADGAATPVRAPADADGAPRALKQIVGLVDGGRGLAAVTRRSSGAPAPELVVMTEDGRVTSRAAIPATDRVAYDDLHHTWIVAGGSSIQLYADGRALGGIGGAVHGVGELRYDAGADRLYAYVEDGFGRPPWYELDLAEGVTRALAPEGDVPALFAEPSGLNGVNYALHDARGPGGGTALPVVGLEGHAQLTSIPNDRTALALFAAGDRLALVDIPGRRVASWLARPNAEGITRTYAADRGATLLVATARDLEVYSVVSGKQLRSGSLPAGELTGLVQLPDGRLLLGTFKGAWIAPSTSDLRWAAIAPGVAVFDPVVAPDGAHIAFNGTFSDTALCPLVPALSVDRCVRFPGRGQTFLRGGAEIAVTDAEGVTIRDVATGVLKGKVILGGGGASLFLTPDGAYKASPGGLDLGVMAFGLRSRILEDLDLQLNRPSAVLAAFGRATPERVAAYRAIEERRIAAAGARPDPTLTAPGWPALALDRTPPIYSAAPELPLRMRVTAGDSPVTRVVARVNGVPVWGAAGRAIAAVAPGTARTVSLALPLATGVNRVLLTAIDGGGREAFGESFIVTGTAERPPGKVYLLAVGVSRYPTRPLAYPAKDVGDVADAMKALLGDRLVVERLVDAQAQRAAVLAARTFLARATIDDLVVVYLAGHGLLDGAGRFHFATVDTVFDADDPGGLTVADLEGLLDGLAVGGKILFIDACHAGAQRGAWEAVASAAGGRGVVRARSAVSIASADTVTPTDVALISNDLRAGTGATIVTASSQQEVAYESESLKNGFFTHAVLDSLRSGVGARDDGALWLDELATSVGDRVRAQTAGLQAPQVREGNPGFRRPLIEPLRVLARHVPERAAVVHEFAVAPGGRFVTVLDANGVRVVALADGRVAWRAPVPLDAAQRPVCGGANPCDILLAGDGRALFVLAGGVLREAHAASPRWVAAAGTVHGVALTGDGRFLVACRPDGDVAAATSAGASRFERVPLPGCSLVPVVGAAAVRAFSWDDRRVTTLERAGGAWRATRGPALPIDEGTVALDPTGRVAVVALATTEKSSARLFDVVTGRELAQLSGASAIVAVDGAAVAVDVPPALPVWPVADVALIGEGGATVGAISVAFGLAVGRQAHGGLVLAGRTVVFPVNDDQSLSMEALGRTGTRYVRVDVRDGRPVGWFGLPLKDVSLITSDRPEWFALERTTGRVFAFVAPPDPLAPP